MHVLRFFALHEYLERNQSGSYVFKFFDQSFPIFSFSFIPHCLFSSFYQAYPAKILKIESQ